MKQAFQLLFLISKNPEIEKRGMNGMAHSKTYKNVLKIIEVGKTRLDALDDAFDLVRELRNEDMVEVDEIPIYDEQNLKDSMELTKMIRTECSKWIKATGEQNAVDVYRRTLLFDAPFDFDCYCRFLEWDREPRKRFYEPRRKQLLPIVNELQNLADGKIDLLAISMPPGTGKTTLAIFYLTWIGGKNPELSVLGGSHSNSFLRGVYDEMERILRKDGEYNYAEVFPRSPLVRTNSKDLRLDLAKSKRFETFEFSSIGSGNAGKVRASRLLYCDDLVDGIETAMSADRLDKLWQQYYTDLRQRKIGNCQELHIATRWSVRDPIGRLQVQYENDPRARFLAFPALNEEDESNFDYPYSLGFTTEFYRKQRDIMDDVSWSCLYMNEPVERTGLLFYPEQLRRYFELPQEQPDSIIAVCDTKDQGPDYCVMPIAYRYGDDFYIEKIVCDNGDPKLIEERLVAELISHKVRNCQFESNRGAGRIAEMIQNRIRERGGFTRITTKWTQSNKEARIIAESSFVKDHFLFKDESLYDKEYRTAMSMLCGWTMSGKNRHDDCPDAMSMLSDYIQNVESGRVTLMQRIF